MAGRIRLVGTATATEDGQVQGTYELIREGLPTHRFQHVVPGNATVGEIGQSLVSRCLQIVEGEPPPSLHLVNKMFEGGPLSLPQPATPQEGQGN